MGRGPGRIRGTPVTKPDRDTPGPDPGAPASAEPPPPPAPAEEGAVAEEVVPAEEARPARKKAARPAGEAAPPAPPAGDTKLRPLRSPPVELAIGAAWIVGLAGAGQVVATLFRSNPLAIVVLHAVIVDLAAGRAGVRWEPGSESDTGSDYGVLGRRIGLGAGVALAVAGGVVAVGALLGWAKVSVHGPTMSLGLGLVRAVALGVRDALLYAGLPLYFVGRARGIPRVAGVVFGALAAGAALVLQAGATPANVALAVAVGAAVAAFWARDGEGWAAAGVAGGFPFFAGVALRGGLLDVDWTRGSFAAGLPADGAPAWLGAAAFLGVAAWLLRRRPARA